MEANTNDHNQFQNCFFNPNWETSMDQGTDPFESALSSIVSSPAASHAGPADGDNIMIKELIGRLGVICNSGDISPQSFFEAKSTNNSTNTSCYTTPLNSPPKLSLSSVMDHQIRSNFPVPGTQFPHHQGLVPFSADPGFAERAARLSCFSSRNFSPLNGNFSLNPSELPPSRGSVDHPMKVATGGSHFAGNSAPGEMGDSREGSSLSEQIPAAAAAADFGANPRKRKSAQRGKQKDQPPSTKSSEVTVAEKEEPWAKKAKSEEDGDGKKDEETGDAKKQSKDSSNSKPQEPPKDYIHVRARRGQATDSHSLAERVRREKISQRMKVLQDLVPGCNKVTGKAIMLDEIINYVQSLQRQVEFLSMKLSTLNPRMDFNVEALVSKEMFQSRGSLPHSVFPMEEESPTFPYGDAMSQFSANLLSSRNQGMQMPPVEAAFSNAPLQVSGGMWEDDLQSLVQMGIPQNQSYGSSSQMKVEL